MKAAPGEGGEGRVGLKMGNKSSLPYWSSRIRVGALTPGRTACKENTVPTSQWECLPVCDKQSQTLGSVAKIVSIPSIKLMRVLNLQLCGGGWDVNRQHRLWACLQRVLHPAFVSESKASPSCLLNLIGQVNNIKHSVGNTSLSILPSLVLWP